jgi:hypothetical protein
MQTTIVPAQRALEFGIYRDGDNNLDASQGEVVKQALDVSAKDSRIGFAVEDTTARAGGALHTDDFTIADGGIGDAHVGKAHDMASPTNLAQFVAHTLDEAQKSGAKQTWIDLVDHGAGDGGGLEADSTHHVMPMPQIAQAIADGVALHAKEHPEDAGRNVDGVVANQCLMASLGFADALSSAGVKYLAASPETMLSPGTPTTVAEAIASHENDPGAMAKAVVGNVMHTRYGDGIGDSFGPAAAFDVLDLDPQKVATMRAGVKSLNDAMTSASHDPGARAAMRDDIDSVDGMVRFPQSKGLPWHADRPAMATYDAIAHDSRLGDDVRTKALAAERDVDALVLAHRESHGFAPFGGSDYSDAAGPTVHLPTDRKQIDPWAPAISETDNAFYKATDAGDLVNALA